MFSLRNDASVINTQAPVATVGGRRKTVTAIENVLNVMADVSVQNERINGWIPSSATNVIMIGLKGSKNQPHDDRDNCFLPFDSKNGPCGMTVNNDIDDDSATKDGDSHTRNSHRHSV